MPAFACPWRASDIEQYPFKQISLSVYVTDSEDFNLWYIAWQFAPVQAIGLIIFKIDGHTNRFWFYNLAEERLNPEFPTLSTKAIDDDPVVSKVYTIVVVVIEPATSGDATPSGVTLSRGTLAPAFFVAVNKL